MGDPSQEEIDDFVKANDIDDRAAGDLKDCPPTVQRAVLSRGDLSTARNPSAALLVRIRDARVGNTGGGTPGLSVGLPSSADIDSYIKRNDIDRSTGEKLRTSSPTIKRAVLAGGDLVGAPNPSAVLALRMADAKRAGAANVMLSAGMSLPSSVDIEDFIKNNDVDKNSADQLRSSPPIVQRVVISRGDLRTARNPSAALLARIRDAKVGTPAHGMMPGFPGYPPFGYPPMFPPPPGGYPPPPGDGNPGSSSGYPPPGYPPPFGNPYFMPPPGPYGFPPPPGYPGYPPPPGAPPAAPADPRRRSRSGSSSYSYSVSYSCSRSRSRSPTPKKPQKRGGRGERRGGRR